MMTAQSTFSESDVCLRDRLTELIANVGRLSDDLITSGDTLVENLGLTNARYQVLAAIAGTLAPQPVAQHSRDMGITRQAIQRVVNELRDDGFVRVDSSPQHVRTKLVTMTKKGRSAYRTARARRDRWVDALAADLVLKDVDAVVVLVCELQRRISRLPLSTLIKPEAS